MNNNSFNKAITVNQSPEKVFNDILNLRGWWTEQFEGSTTELNAESIMRYKDIHYCKIKLVEKEPNSRIAWLVLDNHFSFVEDKTEWIGTKLVFNITEKDGKTEVHFTHEGLVPDYECYELCNEAWTNYITNSLVKYLTTGKGEPNPKDEEGYNAELAEKWGITK